MTREIATTTGAIKGGVLRIRHRTRFAASFARMKDCEVVIRIERPSSIRSLRANAYYWSTVVRMIAEESGHEPEDVHDFLCLRFLTKRLTWVNEATGEIEEKDIPGRSRKLSINDFYEFVEKARLWAGEFLSLTIPDPDPEHWRVKERRAA